jgi:hypothetical protein
MQPDEQRRQDEETDFSRFAMNPVDHAEKEDRAAALRRTLKAAGIIVGIVVVVLAITYWAKVGHETGVHGMPLDQARDPSLRLKAEEFKETLIGYVPRLEGRLDAVQFTGPTEIGIAIKPAIRDSSGATRPVTGDDVRSILDVACREFVSFLRALEVVDYSKVTVRAYLKGAVIGTAEYDRRTKETKIEIARSLEGS